MASLARIKTYGPAETALTNQLTNESPKTVENGTFARLGVTGGKRAACKRTQVEACKTSQNHTFRLTSRARGGIEFSLTIEKGV